MNRIGIGRTAGIGIVALAIAGCGPTVELPSEGDEGSAETGSPTTTESTTSASDDGDSASSGVFDEGSGSPGAFCGNGVVEGIEACDDGNDMDADGCSRSCELSGSLSWRLPFDVERGYGVGLDARDGEAYVLVMDYHEFEDVESISSRVSTLGDIVAQYVHLGGLADIDVARDAIASMPGGEVIVGYPSPEGRLFRLDLDSGPVWMDPMDTWRFSASTKWFGGEVFTLRSDADTNQLAMLRFTDTGDLLETWWLDDALADARPLRAGALFPRAGAGAVALTVGPSGLLRMHSFIGGPPYSVDFGAPSPDEPRAFAHDDGIVIWTTTDRFTIDMFDHLLAQEPRLVPGFVLTSFVGGFVILDGSRIDVYDDAGVLRWSHEPAAVPRLAMADGIGGLFVLSDAGPAAPDSNVVLERLVL